MSFCIVYTKPNNIWRAGVHLQYLELYLLPLTSCWCLFILDSLSCSLTDLPRVHLEGEPLPTLLLSRQILIPTYLLLTRHCWPRTVPSCYLVRFNLVSLTAGFWLSNWAPCPDGDCAEATQYSWVSSCRGCCGGLLKSPLRTEALITPEAGRKGSLKLLAELLPWNYPQPKIATSPKIMSFLPGSMHPVTGQCRVKAWPLCFKSDWSERPSDFQSSFSSTLSPGSQTHSPSQPTPIAKSLVHFVQELRTRGQFTDKQIALT